MLMQSGVLLPVIGVEMPDYTYKAPPNYEVRLVIIHWQGPS